MKTSPIPLCGILPLLLGEGFKEKYYFEPKKKQKSGYKCISLLAGRSLGEGLSSFTIFITEFLLSISEIGRGARGAPDRLLSSIRTRIILSLVAHGDDGATVVVAVAYDIRYAAVGSGCVEGN